MHNNAIGVHRTSCSPGSSNPDQSTFVARWTSCRVRSATAKPMIGNPRRGFPLKTGTKIEDKKSFISTNCYSGIKMVILA